MTKHSSTSSHRRRHVRATVVGCAALTVVTAAAVVARPAQNPPERAAGATQTAAATTTITGVAQPSSGPSRAQRAEDLANKAAAERQRLAELAEARAEAQARAKARAERRAAALAKARAEAARNPDPAVFQLASFNVLGDSHTRRGGNKPGYASGVTRIGMAAQALAAAGVDVVGFQEYESVQHHAFMRRTGGSWGVFPGASMGNNAVRNSIAWKHATWTALEQHTIPIPYFRGNRVPMPYVLLQHDATGRRMWVINIHNPASSARRGNNERWRDLGTSLQISLMNRLRASGTPVVLMGDFNERAEAFCAVTARAGAVAANGGSTSPCRPPAGAGIDWIFGTPDIGFSSYMRVRTPLVARTSDHPLITSTAVLDGPLP